MILYEMPWIMNAAWRIVKTWLGPEAISKLKFVSKSEVQAYIDAEHLPPHMGGMVRSLDQMDSWVLLNSPRSVLLSDSGDVHSKLQFYTFLG
ncbi:motile sperm domain-containing protein 2 isoform X1 [Tachysurus ichikawai]